MTVFCCKNCGSEFGLKTSHVLTESKMTEYIKFSNQGRWNCWTGPLSSWWNEA